jgi:glycosyltransferase involved in cell wall biosynthesis
MSQDDPREKRSAMNAARTIGVMARLLDQQDGLGVYSRELLQHLFLLDPTTRYVVFLGSGRAESLFKGFENVATCVLPRAGKLWWDQVLVPRAARRYGVDLLFNPKFSLPLLTRIPGVFVLQSCDWYVNPGNYPWWDNLYIRLTLPLYCRKASGLLAISQATLNELSVRTGLNLSAASVTHAGVGASFTAQRDPVSLREFRQHYSLPERYIFTVARVLHTGHARMPAYPGGNNERLIRAYRLYRQRARDPLPLVIAGRAVRQYLLARGFSQGDLEGIHFLGFVPNEQIHQAYQLADCFVLATLCESFGIPILEALASGCPAIVPSTGAAPEVAGNAARLIDPHDEQDIARALLEVVESPPLREHLAIEGIGRARAFTWQQAAQRVLRVFDAVLGGAQRAEMGVRAS